MRQNVFTTHFLEFGGQFHSAVWLRVKLPHLVDHRLAKLRRQAARFRAEFCLSDPEGTSDAHELLFQRYRTSREFELSPTLRSLLYGRKRSTAFQTYELNLYDGNQLIAAGIFDRGGNSAAGITCFFDPAYRKYSLGKYLIHLKLEYCRDQGLEWFYPGYFVPGNPRFDYKLDVGTEGLEWLDLATGQWNRWLAGQPVPDPLRLMERRLAALGDRLQASGIEVRQQHYQHLDINLNPQIEGRGLFDFPVLLNFAPLFVVFDPRDSRYHVLACRSVYHFEQEPAPEGVFASDLLVADQDLFESADPEAVAACLLGFRALVSARR